MLWILFSFSIAAWATPQQIELVGYSDQNPAWKIELKVDKTCEFRGRHYSSSKTVTVSKSGAPCIDIAKELTAVVTETRSIPDNNIPKVETFYTDEPSFVFVLGAKTFQARFESPKTCVFKDTTSADMICEDNKLSAAQRLLLLLRPAAREMKFIR